LIADFEGENTGKFILFWPLTSEFPIESTSIIRDLQSKFPVKMEQGNNCSQAGN